MYGVDRPVLIESENWMKQRAMFEAELAGHAHKDVRIKPLLTPEAVNLGSRYIHREEHIWRRAKDS